ncbi:MAG: hypothetical protein GX053_01005 [Tissierella sp.]|nr:hypothetical protein [Tissierella sp.]
MNSSKRLFRFLCSYQLGGAGVFWIVMLIVNALSSVLAFSIKSNVTMGPHIKSGQLLSFAGANMLAIFIYFIVYGLEMYYESFSLTSGFGVTRKNFYLNVIVNNIIMVLIFSVVQFIFLKIDNYAVSKLGFEPIVEFGLFSMNDSSLWIISVLSFILLVFTSIMNLIGILQYRFGYKFWISFGIFGLVTQMLTNFIEILTNSFGTIIQTLSEGYLTAGITIIIIAYTIGYMLIRRANIK